MNRLRSPSPPYPTGPHARRPLRQVRLASPFLLRSVEPPLEQVESKEILGLRRLGKRIVFDLEDDPHELHDRSADPEYQSRMLEYAQKALSWRLNHDERVLANFRVTGEGLTEFKGPRR